MPETVQKKQVSDTSEAESKPYSIIAVWTRDSREKGNPDKEFKSVDIYFFDDESDRPQYFGRASKQEHINSFKRLFKAMNLNPLTY